MIQALPNKVLVHNMQRGEQKTAGGIILRNDEGKSEGIHNRWCQVFSVGTGVEDIEAGEWILVEHGRWTREIRINEDSLYLVDYPSGVLLASPTLPKAQSLGLYQSLSPVIAKESL